jgi:hypothetical protein
MQVFFLLLLTLNLTEGQSKWLHSRQSHPQVAVVFVVGLAY